MPKTASSKAIYVAVFQFGGKVYPTVTHPPTHRHPTLLPYTEAFVILVKNYLAKWWEIQLAIQ